MMETINTENSKLKLSIWSSYYIDLKVEAAVKRFVKNGIYCSELSDEHGLELLSRSEDVTETGKKFAEFLKENNFEVSQGHLWLKAAICSDNSAVETLYKWIDLYEAIGIKNMVLHCDRLLETDLTKQEKNEKNVEKLLLLAEYVKGRDITICLENLCTYTISVDDLLYLIERVGSPNFGICLDTGHLNITVKDQREFILKAGKHLKALHIADNEGEYDQHLMPYTRGTVDFKEVVKALNEIDYKGVFNHEIPGETHIPLELRDAKLEYVKSCYRYLFDIK